MTASPIDAPLSIRPVAHLYPYDEPVPVMTEIAPTTLSQGQQALFAKADAKLLRRIEVARDRGDERAVRKLVDLRHKARATYFATASKVKKRQRMRGIENVRTVPQMALDAFSNEAIEDVKVFAIRKPDSDKLRIVCSYAETDTIRQLIVKDSITAAHSFHESQYGIQKKPLQRALQHIAGILKHGEWSFGAELDSTNHFVMVNPNPLIERYGISSSMRDDVITNKGKETNNKIHITNALARANRALAISHATRGLPQGAGSSSAIASASISAAIKSFCDEWGDRTALINYADNFYLFTKTQADMESASQNLIAHFETEEGLSLRVKTPCVPLSQGLDLLGFTVLLEEGQPIVRLQHLRHRTLIIVLRRKMHELFAASKRCDTMLDQIYTEAISLFVNKVGPLAPAHHSVCSLMEFFGGQLLNFGQLHKIDPRDLLRLARFCKRRYPARENLESNTFGKWQQ